MKVITNKGRRRLGIPGSPALVLGAEESAKVTDKQVAEFEKNRTTKLWLERGVLVLTDEGEDAGPPDMKPKQRHSSGIVKPGRGIRPERDKREVEELPDGVEGDGVEMHHSGGGWWSVYVNGFKVTDRKVRKDEAESIAKEYE